jgi:hypothetical protein
VSPTTVPTHGRLGHPRRNWWQGEYYHELFWPVTGASTRIELLQDVHSHTTSAFALKPAGRLCVAPVVLLHCLAMAMRRRSSGSM